MTTFKMLDWDWGETANQKLSELCENQQQKDVFCEYLLNEKPVDDLVWHVLRYVPIEVLKEIAKDAGVYDMEEEDD